MTPDETRLRMDKYGLVALRVLLERNPIMKFDVVREAAQVAAYMVEQIDKKVENK